MTIKKKILITSALPYVNNVPHLGNIVGCVLSADVYARFNRSVGNETLYICGTDEHGTATENKALEEGLTPKQICDKYHVIHKEIYDWFGISFDFFGRTSHPKHFKITQDIFTHIQKNGFVTEREVEQLYCEKCNKFLADRFVEGTCPFCGYEDARGDQCDVCGKLLDPTQLINPKCKVHKIAPIVKSTKHLFIDLSKLQGELEAWVETQSKKGNWPENAVTTTKAWFKEGLKERAITRDLKWGVPVPVEGYEDKVFYVWFDAPIGYISITAEHTDSWKDWWMMPKEVALYQFMAKDNIPFHTIIFPATLIGTKQHYTMLHHISSTEYLNYEGGKFSKSRGVGVFGDDAKKSGIPADAYRYYLLINRPETADTTFSWQEFGARINNELVANIGNFVNRTLSFISRYENSEVKESKLEVVDKKFWERIEEQENIVKEQLESVRIKEALKTIMGISQIGNQFFQECQPWKTKTENPEDCRRSLYLLTNLVKDLAIMIEPFMPETSKKIFHQLNVEVKDWHDLGRLSIKDHKIGMPQILFSKVEDKRMAELKELHAGKKKTEEKSDDNFSLLNLRVGKIISVEKHPNADKLFIEQVDFGSEGSRQIVSGLAEYYAPDELVGKKVVVVMNLETAKIRGVESQGMLLAAEDKKHVGVLYVTDSNPGDSVLVSGFKPNENRISFTDFLKVKMTVKNHEANFSGKNLVAGNENEIVKSEKVAEGSVR